MSQATQAFSFNGNVLAPELVVEQLTEPDQITSTVALGAMQVLARAYAASPGIRSVVPHWAIYDHFVPLDAERKLMPRAIEERQAHMQANLAKKVTYWVAREDMPDGNQMTGLAKSSPSVSSVYQKLLRKAGLETPNVFIGELVEGPEAHGAEVALLHTIITHGGYKASRKAVIDVYDVDTSQVSLVRKTLSMERVAPGNSYEIAGESLRTSRYADRISTVQMQLEASAGWLKTSQPIS